MQSNFDFDKKIMRKLYDWLKNLGLVDNDSDLEKIPKFVSSGIFLSDLINRIGFVISQLLKEK